METFTTEQVERMIADKLAEAKGGFYTEEDVNKKVTAEVDRRVESGIQKGLETQKKRWEQEFSEKAKLSAEEIARREVEEQLNVVRAKEQEIKKKANQLEAKELLSGAEIPKSQYEKFIAVLVSDDEEATKLNVQNFIDTFNSTKSEIEAKVRSEFSSIKQPSQGTGTETTTKDDFNKMGYADKIKFKDAHPELYKEFMK